MQKYIKQNWFTVLVGVMLLLAIPSIWPYSYYQILRWVVAMVASYNAYNSYKSKNNNWTIVMIGVAILFNPISSIHFEKSTWAVLDAIAAVVMFVYIKKK
jgi:hypothetical protein